MKIEDVTLSDILERCRVCEHCGAPTHFVGGDPRKPPTIDLVVDGARRKLFVRRVVWQLRYPARRLPDGTTSVITSACANHRCVNPELIAHASRSDAWKQAAKRGAWSSATSRAKTIKAVRAKSKLPEHGVQDILQSADRPADLARKWGVSESYVYMLKRRQFRRPLGDPFSGLGAR